MGDHGTNVIARLPPGMGPTKPKSSRHEIKLKQRHGSISTRPNLGSGPVVGMKAMLALFSLPVELLGVAIVFISVMAGMLAAAAE
jgi:hypothetical protein